MGGVSARVDRVQKPPFYASLWQLSAWDRRLAVASNVGSMEWKVQTTKKPSQKPEAVEALEWRQSEKCPKIAFARSGPFSHILSQLYYNIEHGNAQYTVKNERSFQTNYWLTQL